MMWFQHGIGYGATALVMMALFWVGFVAFGALLIARLFPRTANSNRETEQAHNPDAPLALLQRRYARGEIMQDEYEQMRRDLTASSNS